MTKPKINYQLLDILSPSWGKRFRAGLRHEDYQTLIMSASNCLVGCFYNYTDHYLMENGSIGMTGQRKAEYCPTCKNIANDSNGELYKGVAYILKRRWLRYGQAHPTFALSYSSASGITPMPKALSKLDEEAIGQLNQMLEFFYNHTKEKHPHILVEKMEQVLKLK